MDARRERRLPIYAPAKLMRIDHPEPELECLLLDISAAGIKFVCLEDLQVDDMIVLDAEDHLVLADVRHSEPRGERYAIGAERIHTVDKSSAPAAHARTEQVRFVVEDYRRRIRAAILEQEPAHTEHSGTYREQVIASAVQQLVQHWAKEAEEPATDGSLRAAIIEWAGRQASEGKRVSQKSTESQPAVHCVNDLR